MRPDYNVETPNAMRGAEGDLAARGGDPCPGLGTPKTRNTARPSDPTWTRAAAVGFLALSFLVLGCLVVENEVNYAAWRVLAQRDLVAHHAAVEAGLRTTMFPLMAGQLAAGAVLLARPPAHLGRWPVAGVLLLFVLVLAVSFAFQVPLHRAIADGGGPAAVEALIRSHAATRRPVEALAALTSLWALWRFAYPARLPTASDADRPSRPS